MHTQAYAHALGKSSETSHKRQPDVGDGRDNAGRCILKAATYRTSWKVGSARCFTPVQVAAMKKNLALFNRNPTK